MSIRCKSCGQKNRDNDQFCIECGSPLKSNGIGTPVNASQNRSMVGQPVYAVNPDQYVDRETYGKMKLQLEQLQDRLEQSPVVSGSFYPPNFTFDRIEYVEFRGHVHGGTWESLDDVYLPSTVNAIVGIETTYKTKSVGGEVLNGTLSLDFPAIGYAAKKLPLPEGIRFHPINPIEREWNSIEIRPKFMNTETLTYEVFLSINFYLTEEQR